MILRCDCGGIHFICIERLFNDDPPLLSIESAYMAQGWWDRVKMALYVLGDGIAHRDEVILSEKTARQVVDEINLYLERKDDGEKLQVLRESHN